MNSQENQGIALETSIFELKLSTAAINALRRVNIHTLGELLEHTCYDLLRTRTLGHVTLDNVRQCLGRMGLALKHDDYEVPVIGFADFDKIDNVALLRKINETRMKAHILHGNLQRLDQVLTDRYKKHHRMGYQVTPQGKTMTVTYSHKEAWARENPHLH